MRCQRSPLRRDQHRWKTTNKDMQKWHKRCQRVVWDGTILITSRNTPTGCRCKWHHTHTHTHTHTLFVVKMAPYLHRLFLRHAFIPQEVHKLSLVDSELKQGEEEGFTLVPSHYRDLKDGKYHFPLFKKCRHPIMFIILPLVNQSHTDNSLPTSLQIYMKINTSL